MPALMNGPSPSPILLAVMLMAGLIALPSAMRLTANEPPARLHDVDIREFAFTPAELTIRLGDAIVWTNRDFAPHTATSAEGDWDTSEIAYGQSSRQTPTQLGVFDYICVFHPTMKARLIVTR